MTTPVLQHGPPARVDQWLLTRGLVLGAAPTAPAATRLFVTETLTTWYMQDLIEAANIVATELVTNAVQALWRQEAITTVRVWLWADGQSVVVEVWDGAEGLPRPNPREDGGWGLRIVAGLCETWGVYRDRAGKIVWGLLL